MTSHRIRAGQGRDANLGILGAACLIAAVCMVSLPANKRGGPSVRVLYALVGGHLSIWALVYAAAAAAAFRAVYTADQGHERRAYVTLLVLGAVWTSGFTWTLFGSGPGSFWAPLTWLVLTVLGVRAYRRREYARAAEQPDRRR